MIPVLRFPIPQHDQVKSNTETNQLGIPRWSRASCMIVFKYSFPRPHCLFFPLKNLSTQSLDGEMWEFLHLGNSNSSCYNLHSTEREPHLIFSTIQLSLIVPKPQKSWLTWDLGYMTQNEQNSCLNLGLEALKLEALPVLVAHFKNTQWQGKAELLTGVKPVTYSTTMCVRAVWPHHHRVLDNGAS